MVHGDKRLLPVVRKRGQALSRNGHRTYIVIDAGKCKGCLLCVSACAKGVIGTGKELNRGGYFPAVVVEEKSDLCTGCLNCTLMCPDTAISIYAGRTPAPIA